jgi:hypothetical protein
MALSNKSRGREEKERERERERERKIEREREWDGLKEISKPEDVRYLLGCSSIKSSDVSFFCFPLSRQCGIALKKPSSVFGPLFSHLKTTTQLIFDRQVTLSTTSRPLSRELISVWDFSVIKAIQITL